MHPDRAPGFIPAVLVILACSRSLSPFICSRASPHQYPGNRAAGMALRTVALENRDRVLQQQPADLSLTCQAAPAVREGDFGERLPGFLAFILGLLRRAPAVRSPPLPPQARRRFPAKLSRESLESLSPWIFLSCWPGCDEPGFRGRPITSIRTYRDTQGFSAHSRPPFRHLIRRKPPLSVGSLLYPCGIAYRSTYGFSHPGLIKKSLCSPLYGHPPLPHLCILIFQDLCIYASSSSRII